MKKLIGGRTPKAFRLCMAMAVVGGLAVLPVIAAAPQAAAAGPIISSCTLGYPVSGATGRPAVTFNESTVLRAFSTTPTGVHAWYSDEHTMELGVQTVVQKNSAGAVTSTTNYPVTALPSVPATSGPPLQTGATMAQLGVDPQGRPLGPGLFVTDITTNSASKSGDWQQGSNSPFSPDIVSGTWKAGTVTYQTGKAEAVDTGTDSSTNSTFGPGADTPPSGISYEGFRTEVTWNFTSLGLAAGHLYRLEFMVHDGDHTGDSGEACINVAMPSPAPIKTDSSNPSTPNEVGVTVDSAIPTAIGTVIHDTAFVTGNSSFGRPSGTVNFNLYFVPLADIVANQNALPANPCDAKYFITSSSGTLASAASPPNGGFTNVATSANYTTGTALGTYVWQDSYVPDAASKWLANNETCATEQNPLVAPQLTLNPFSAVNVVGAPHTVTALLATTPLNGLSGDFTNLVNGVPLSWSFVGTTNATYGAANQAQQATDTCTTGAAGTCSRTIVDSLPELVTMHAQNTSFTVQGVLGTFSAATGSHGSCSPANPATATACDSQKLYVKPNTTLSVVDTMNLNVPANTNVTGTVTYTYFPTLTDCQGQTNGTTVGVSLPITNNVIPPSTPSVQIGPGSTAYFMANYAGNLGNFTTDCTQEFASSQ